MLVRHVANQAACGSNPQTEALEGKDVSRNASELDSACGLGEPASERRSPSDANDLVRGVTDRTGCLPDHAVKPERQ